MNQTTITKIRQKIRDLEEAHERRNKEIRRMTAADPNPVHVPDFNGEYTKRVDEIEWWRRRLELAEMSIPDEMGIEEEQ